MCIEYTKESGLSVQEFKALFYKMSDGTEPAKEFLNRLDKKMRAKMIRTIAVFESNGTNLREPYSKHIEDGIFELRAQIGSDITRVMYFFVVGRRAVLTHGFIKKTDKTPLFEIERAKSYRSDYLSREENRNDRV